MHEQSTGTDWLSKSRSREAGGTDEDGGGAKMSP